MQLRTWGDGYGYVLVATGRIEAMVDPVAELYDLAPMPIILAEAGGRFTSLDGVDGPGHGNGIATNGHVHDELLAVSGADVTRRPAPVDRARARRCWAPCLALATLGGCPEPAPDDLGLRPVVVLIVGRRCWSPAIGVIVGGQAQAPPRA